MREVGDKLYVAKIYENHEDPIPEGSFGCFEPFGRPNINQNMEAMMTMIKDPKIEADILKKNLYTHVLEDFRNDVVQIYYAANEAFIIKNVPRAIERF